MKYLFLLLNAVCMLFTACETTTGESTESSKNDSGSSEIPLDKTTPITFADIEVMQICCENWDTNNDGALSYEEASMVADIGTLFKMSEIWSFTELKYFTKLTYISDYAFFGCSKLTNITLPDNITSIGESAFSDCHSLKFINLPNKLIQIAKLAFYNCRSITEISIPKGITKIEDNTFIYCRKLTNITLPAGLKYIGWGAFCDCDELPTITIPQSTTEIGGHAFEGCDCLSKVYCISTTPPSGNEDMFPKNAESFNIFVPTKSANAYKTAEYWNDYADIIVGYDF